MHTRLILACKFLLFVQSFMTLFPRFREDRASHQQSEGHTCAITIGEKDPTSLLRSTCLLSKQ